jgi:hypothetical protein
VGVGTRRLAARATRGGDRREDVAGVKKEREKNMLPKIGVLIILHDESVKLEKALKNLLESARAHRDAVDIYEAQGKSSDSSDREFVTASNARLAEIETLEQEVSLELDALRDLWLKR